MKLYVCEHCNFSSKIKTHYERHINTKKHRGIVENLEKDELDEYTKEKGKQLKKVWNDERRAKEAAIKERDHAAKLAKQALEENKLLRQHLTQGEKVLMDNSKSSAEHELALAKKTFKEAYDAGDADLVAEASEKLASAKLNMAKAEEYVPQYTEEALQTREDSVNNESETSVILKALFTT